MGSRLRGSKGITWRGLHKLPISPATTPITLTSILSQDGRGSKKGGYEGYAKVFIKGEGIKRGGPGPTRFFVAGPPQNDMKEEGLFRMIGVVGGRDKRGDGFPPSREQERGSTPISIFPHQGGRGKKGRDKREMASRLRGKKRKGMEKGEEK